jgi:hypothetical protein
MRLRVDLRLTGARRGQGLRTYVVLLATCIHAGFCFAYSSTLKMRACFPETLVKFQRTTRRFIPEDRTLQSLDLSSLMEGTFDKTRNSRNNLYLLLSFVCFHL